MQTRPPEQQGCCERSNFGAKLANSFFPLAGECQLGEELVASSVDSYFVNTEKIHSPAKIKR